MPDQGTRLTSRAIHVVASFDAGVTDPRSRAAGLLHTVIADSPHLTAQLNAAVASGRVTRFEHLPADTNASGQYTPATGAVQLRAQDLPRPDHAELAFVLGHELQHAINAPAMDRAIPTFFHEVHAAAQSTLDYTDAIERLVNAQRQDEARANLAGWNAMVDIQKRKHPGATLGEVAQASPDRAIDFATAGLDGAWTARPNIMINSDLTVDLSDHNIKGMGENFFDKPAKHTGLGYHGDSDYINYYTAWAVGEAAQLHAALNPAQPMRLDLARLRATRWAMERNGISLGSAQPAVPFVDHSTRPPTTGLFHHTEATHQFIPLQRHLGHDQLTAEASPSAIRLAQLTFHRQPQRPPRSTSVASAGPTTAAVGRTSAPRTGLPGRSAARGVAIERPE